MVLRYCFFICLFLVSCAQVQPLGGGEKDETAPIPNLERSNPVFASTDVKPSRIKIPFNEYIKLNNPNTNILITPELVTKPKFEVRGKDLIITLDSNELLDNTTYSFVFNKAIADINENNDTTFTFVFSTGKIIDSLSYAVLVIDNDSQTPVTNAMVGLYVLSDSLNPYKHRPKYVAQTNKEGVANFSYLPEQHFEVFGYKNKDGGGITKNSMIAFLSKPIKIDTLFRKDTLYLFQPRVEEERGKILKKDLTLVGRIELVTNFDHRADQIRVFNDDDLVDVLIEPTSRLDSSIVWIKARENTAYTLTIPFNDTLLSTRVFSRKLPEHKVKYVANTNAGELEINNDFSLIFDLPIQSIDSSRIFVYTQDTLLVPNNVVIRDLRSLTFLSVENHNKVRIEPGAVTFYNGLTYQDSIDVKFTRKTEKRYANLELILEQMPHYPLILRLHRGKELVAEKNVPIQDSIVSFPLMQPGDYFLQVIVDLNDNGCYDLGDFSVRRQPEPVIWFRQPITLRANWDTTQPVQFKKMRD
jgi:hypothetical protein